jgi:hypothetical protein
MSTLGDVAVFLDAVLVEYAFLEDVLDGAFIHVLELVWLFLLLLRLLLLLALSPFGLWEILDPLGDEVEDGLVLDRDAEEGLLELTEVEADVELLGDQLALGEVLEDKGDVLGVDDCRQFKAGEEAPPTLEDDLAVVALLRQRDVGVVQQEVEDGLEVGLELLEGCPDGLTLE